MRNTTPGGRFIPFRKSDLITMCLDAGLVPRQDEADLNDFHRLLESLKNAFAPINPDADNLSRRVSDPEQRRQDQKLFVCKMRTLLDAAAETRQAKDWGCEINFEVDDALAKLERWGLEARRNARLVVRPLPEAKTRLNQLWDHFFAFQESDSP